MIRTFAGLVAGCAIAFALLSWRLSQGPVSIAFLSPYIKQAFSTSDMGFGLEFEDTVLAWTLEDRSLDLTMKDVRIIHPGGAVAASVPELSVNLRGRALLGGEIAPTRIAISGVKLRLVRDLEGRIGLDVEMGREEGRGKDFFLALLDEINRPPVPGTFTGSLTQISVRHADLTLDDQQSENTFRAPDSYLNLWRAENGIRGSVRSTISFNDQPVTVVANARFDRNLRSIDVQASFDGLRPATLARNGKLFEALRPADFPVSGDISFSFDMDGRFGPSSFDLALGEGRLSLPDLYPQPLPVTTGHVTGHYFPDAGRVDVTDLYLDTGGPVIDLKASVDVTDQGIGLRGAGGFKNLPINDLDKYWPPALAKPGRKWATRNIRDGRVPEGRVQFNLPVGALGGGDLPKDAVTLDFSFEDMVVDYFSPMPKVAMGGGRGRLTERRLTLEMDHGRVGDMKVSEGNLLIEDFSEPARTATIDLVLSGPTAQILALFDHEPLHLVRPLNIDPKAVGGASAMRGKIVIPLMKGLKLDDIDFAAAANIQDAALPLAFADIRLSEGDLQLKVDKSHLEIAGAAALNKAPVTINWVRNFAADAPFGSRYRVRGDLDDAGRERLGFDTLPFLTGKTPVDLVVDQMPDGSRQGRLDMDLLDAEVTLPQIHWRKVPSAPGSFKLGFTDRDQGPFKITAFVAESGDLFAAGQAELVEGNLRRIDFQQIRFGHNDLAVRVERREDGSFAGRVVGASLDLRPFMDKLGSGLGGDMKPNPPFNIEARIARVLISGDLDITGVDATVGGDGKRVNRIEVVGNITGGSSLRFSLQPREGGRGFSLSSDDAGQVLKGAGLFDNMIGGRLRLDGGFDDYLPGSPARGRLVIDDFKVVRTPVLAQILTLGSLGGIGDLLKGEGVAFGRAEMPFRYKLGRLDLIKARAVGSLGLTAEGVVDLNLEKMDLEGSVIPSYTINSVLGKIPFLGQILVGGKGEGIFGITYRVSGPLDEPVVTVNPLSALAPGILRRMFTAPLPQPEAGDGLETLDEKSFR